MSDDREEALGRLVDQSAEFARQAESAAGAAADARGGDATGTVNVTLDDAGRVSAVHVAPQWKQRVGAESLGAAVIEAVQAAAVARLSAWGAAFAGDTAEGGSTPPPIDSGGIDSGGLAERLHELTSPGRMTSEDTRAALLELLALAEDMERGVDEVLDRLPAAEAAEHVGRSDDWHVTVTLTGGGEVRSVRYDRRWLAEAHEINIARQTRVAFAAAYEAAAHAGVQQLIDGSRLGEVRRATQDPLGLARRLRLTD